MDQTLGSTSLPPITPADLIPRVHEGQPSSLGPDEMIARRRVRQRWIRLSLTVGGLILVIGGGVGWMIIQRVRASAARSESISSLPLQPVSRVDFRTRVTASGRVESHVKTMITCQLEQLKVYSEGQSVSSSENAVVIEVIPEGKRVKKGDILCRIDSSEYVEMVRTQSIKTEQATAALEQAQLNLDVAKLAVQEYQKGLLEQSIQMMEGQIKLAQSDVERSADRLRWTADMLVKGYVPVAQKATAERNLAENKLKLLTGRANLDNFRRFGNPRTLKELESEVEKRIYEVKANTQRVSRYTERLAHYQQMVDFCTIRSPHAGIVIYATNRRRNSERLEPGVEVHEKQKLFYLPDLSDMEVVTYLHETVARQVTAGMPAVVKIEGLGNQALPGRVVSLGVLPVSSPVWTTSDEVKYFLATVKLNEVPDDLLPGMSAEVEVKINGDRDERTLAVPTEAVAFEEGHDVCYVAGADGLQRREITLGRSTRSLLEVTQGLVEGEEVVINPNRVDALESLVIPSGEEARERPSEPARSTAADFGPASVE